MKWPGIRRRFGGCRVIFPTMCAIWKCQKMVSEYRSQICSNWCIVTKHRSQTHSNSCYSVWKSRECQACTAKRAFGEDTEILERSGLLSLYEKVKNGGWGGCSETRIWWRYEDCRETWDIRHLAERLKEEMHSIPAAKPISFSLGLTQETNSSGRIENILFSNRF